MNEEKRCVLLVDDNEATNFIHRRLIKTLPITFEVLTAKDGNEALMMLEIIGKNEQLAKPDFIFLDVSMPGMDGFGFLDEYQKFPSEVKEGQNVIMLTTSENVKDKERAFQYPEVKEFINKPLSLEVMDELIVQYMVANVPNHR